VRPPDLVLLKLYAGGTQDLWDIRVLLRTPEHERWAASVELELAVLPKSMRDRWADVRR
jgi:hypothetical protein